MMHISRETKVFLCFTIFCLVVLTPTVVTAEEPEFKRDLFGVWFEPWIFPSDVGVADAYDESDFRQMLSTITSRFGKILLREVVSDMSPGYSYYLSAVSSLAATLNRNRSRAATATTTGGGGSADLESPIQLEMLYYAGSLSNLDDAVANFDVVKGMADHSNSIFGGTVSTLTIRFAFDFSLNSQSLHNFTKVMDYGRKQIGSNMNNYYGYKLGAFLSIEDCTNSEALESALNLLDSITFYRWLADVDYDMGVDGLVEYTTRRLELCKRVMSKMGRKAGLVLTPRFILDYSDTPPPPPNNKNGTQNIGDFVRFWELISGWASATGTSVVLSEAFDNYFERNKEAWRHEGWWRAVVGANGTRFEFQEKASLLEKEEERRKGGGPMRNNTPSTRESSGRSATVTIVSSAVGTGFFVLCLGIMAMCLMYRRLVGQMRNQYLSKEEIQEFFEGSKYPDPGLLPSSSSSYTKELQTTPYNKDLELNYESFKIDNGSLLGVGTSGVVLRGQILKGSGGAGIGENVAVKMTKPSSSSTTGLKGLLYEIKILNYVGEHENIVKLIGAYTAEIMKGRVYIFYELCVNGSLEQYLRSNKSELQAQARPATQPEKRDEAYVAVGVEGYENLMMAAADDEPGTIPQLCAWTSQIVNGMEFLASKRVFHGDLATRNVLLSGDSRVKLSDFGLSRRLYAYTNYVKSQQQPLPWRWMAPESLRAYEFHEKTDVWAFGVTLWEIYSFGDVPFAGLNWSGDFVNRLEQGLKLDQPRFASKNVYALMNKCWTYNPSSRPTFTQLKELLQTYQM